MGMGAITLMGLDSARVLSTHGVLRSSPIDFNGTTHERNAMYLLTYAAEMGSGKASNFKKLDGIRLSEAVPFPSFNVNSFFYCTFLNDHLKLH